MISNVPLNPILLRALPPPLPKEKLGLDDTTLSW
jgi:hypothetical protein